MSGRSVKPVESGGVENKELDGPIRALYGEYIFPSGAFAADFLLRKTEKATLPT
jgi:hypothetical protein